MAEVLGIDCILIYSGHQSVKILQKSCRKIINNFESTFSGLDLDQITNFTDDALIAYLSTNIRVKKIGLSPTPKNSKTTCNQQYTIESITPPNT